MDLIYISNKLSLSPNHYSWKNHPVVEDPEGNRFICLSVLESPSNMAPKVTWFVFGVIGGMDLQGGGKDIVAYGYKQSQIKHGSQMSTFSISGIMALDSEIYLEAEDIVKKCPPVGWKLIQEKSDGNILEGVPSNVIDMSSGSKSLVSKGCHRV